MIRIVLLSGVCALAPLLFYCVYKLRAQPDKGLGEIIARAPILPLGALGLVLMAAVLIAFAQGDGADPSKTYHPPVVRDGVIIPGHFD
jgi:hypothetical protein